MLSGRSAKNVPHSRFHAYHNYPHIAVRNAALVIALAIFDCVVTRTIPNDTGNKHDLQDRQIDRTRDRVPDRTSLDVVKLPGAPHRGRTGRRVTHTALPNGVRLVVWRDQDSPVVAMRALWRGGLLAETPQKRGITHLLARVITRGCGGMSADQIAGMARRENGHLDAVSGRDSFGLRSEWPVDGWPVGLELMARCILGPDLDFAEINAQRQLIDDEIRQRSGDGDFVAFRAFAETLYRAHPYRMSATGWGESPAAIGRRELTAFYRERYPVSGLTLSIVGNVDPVEAMALVRSHFGAAAPRPVGLPERPTESSGSRPARMREVYRYIERDDARLVVGFPGTTLGNRDRHALAVAAAVLDVRLARALRRRGLSRSSRVYSVPGIDPGYVIAQIRCRPAEVAAAFEIARSVIDAMVARPAGPAELEAAGRALIAAHTESRNRPGSAATALAFHEAHGLGARAYLDYGDAIHRVTQRDVARVVAAYLVWDRKISATIAPRAASPEAERRMRGTWRRAPNTGRAPSTGPRQRVHRYRPGDSARRR